MQRSFARTVRRMLDISWLPRNRRLRSATTSFADRWRRQQVEQLEERALLSVAPMGWQETLDDPLPLVGAAEIIYEANMDTDPGWVLEDQWAWGVPTGQGGQQGGNADPTSGATGSNVVGYNLDGDYENGISQPPWAATPAIDCANYHSLTLEFSRWLNVEHPNYDHASVDISSDGSDWTTVWQNTGQISDSSWTPQQIELPPEADAQATLFIRWGMGPTDSNTSFSGWNLDDVVLRGTRIAGKGEIHGSKWNDVNGDGVWDQNEPGLEGWEIYLDINGNDSHEAGEPLTTTDADGNYAFHYLGAGTYTVAEVQQPDWQQTFPVDGSHSVNVEPGATVANIDFGNWQPAEIRGSKWNDINGDGIWDTGEPGLEGWEVFLDTNENDQHDVGEPLTATDAEGDYAFANLAPGKYNVVEVLQPGWRQTHPSSGSHSVEVGSGELLDDVDFGNVRLPGIVGGKWNDLDGNGTWDTGEPGLEGWQIYLDANDNNQHDDGELLTTTDAAGHYAFTGLEPGTYTVAEVLQEGWTQTYPAPTGGDEPAPGVHTVVLELGQPAANVDFGNWQPAEIHGTKWHDLDGNGVRDEGEPVLEGWTIFLDDNQNGELDEGEVSTETDAEGNYAFVGLAGGTHVVVEVQQSAWRQSYPTADGQAIAHSVELEPGERLAGVEFGNWQPTEIRGHKWDDANADGFWDADEPGLAGWTIYVDENFNGRFDAGERSTVTDANGEYALIDLPAGIHAVGEVEQSGWERTYPSGIKAGLQRLFAVPSDDSKAIVELDPETGNELNRFEAPVAPNVDFAGLAYNGSSLFFVTGNTLYELDPEDGTERDSDTLPEGNYGGLTALLGKVYVLDDSHNDILEFDPASDTVTRTLDIDGVNGGLDIAGGLGVLFSPNVLIVSDGWNIIELDPETGVEVDRFSPHGGYAGVATLNGQLYLGSDGGPIEVYTRNGSLLRTIRLDFGVSGLGGDRLVLEGLHEVTTGPGETVEGVDFGNARLAEIRGGKWNDLNGDGIWDADEPGLENWTIYLDENFNGQYNPGERWTRTDADGHYAFGNLPAGKYSVGEFLKNEWTQTYPLGDAAHQPLFALRIAGDQAIIYEVDPTDGSRVNSFFAPGTVSTPGPQGLAFGDNSLFYLDGSGDQPHTLWELDPNTGEVIDSDVVDAGAPSKFAGLAYLKGRVYLERFETNDILVWDPGYDLVTSVLSVSANTVGGLTGADEANLLYDTNGSGTIYAIDPRNGSISKVLRPTINNSDGGLAYVDGHLVVAGSQSPATAYVVDPENGAVVDQFPLAGRGSVRGLAGDGVDAFHAPGSHTVVLLPNQVLEDVDFGNWQPGVLDGFKWNDLNGNGAWDAGEPALEGWRIYLDANENGLFDSGERSVVTDADGHYLFDNLPADTYTVREVVRNGWEQTYPTAAQNHEHVVTIAADQSISNLNFGNWQPAEIHGNKWEDLDADGLWDDNEEGLEGWTIFLDANQNGVRDDGERWTVTDEDGHYVFTDLPAGTYTVAEIVQVGWRQSFPATGETPAAYTIEIEAGDRITNVDFGNWRPAEIHGGKWNDLDGNAVWDVGEPGLPGWTIYLDHNRNGQLDLFEPRTVTDDNGQYAFLDLLPGFYRVAEVRQVGWEQTYPGENDHGVHELLVEPGQNIQNLDFGNAQLPDITGTKWNDLDADGLWDGNESGVPRWPIYLDTNVNGQYDPGEPITRTDDHGYYEFVDVEPGTYIVAEILRLGWEQSFPQATPAEVARISVAGDGVEGNGYSDESAISADGRFVTFVSSADNLVPADTNERDDVFVYDRITRQIERVSIASDGTEGNGASRVPSISGDGRFVAFASEADNLVPGDNNAATDIFVYDRRTDRIQRVSISDNGVEGNDTSYAPAISTDGRFVAFDSYAGNLVPGDSNGARDVFVYDHRDNRIDRVSIASDGTEGNDYSERPAISADGRFVAFYAGADNLVTGDTAGYADVFVHDRQTGLTECVSVSSDGIEANSESWGTPSISADGRFVAFHSEADNLVANDNNGVTDVFLYDRELDDIQRVSLAAGGIEADGQSLASSLSADGRFVAFVSAATNLVAGDTNALNDVFVVDLQSGQIERLSVAGDGSEGDGSSRRPALSADGRFVAFDSDAANLVAGDGNQTTDAFVAPTSAYLQGTHTVVARYSLDVDDVNFGNHRMEEYDVGDTISTAEPVSIVLDLYTRNESIGNGEWNQLDVDMYELYAEAGGSLIATTGPTPGEPKVDTILRLFDSQGNELAFDDDGGPGRYSRIEYGFGETGYYYLGVSGFPNNIYDPGVGGSGDEGEQGAYYLELNTGGLPPGIHGSKWNDLDADGVWDDGEPGLAGWQIYLDENSNGRYDFGEPTTRTEGDGRYAFEYLAPGDYTVAEVLRRGWTATSPDLQPIGHSRLYAIPIEPKEPESKDPDWIVQLDPATGAEMFRFTAPVELDHDFEGLAFYGPSLFLVADDTLYELDADTGAELDKTDLPEADYGGLTVLDGTVYLLDEGASDILVFDPVSDIVTTTFDIDDLNWGEQISGGLSALAEPSALIASDGTQLLQIDPTSGLVTDRFALDGHFAGIATVDGEIYIGSAPAGDDWFSVDVYSRAGDMLRSIYLPYEITALGGDPLMQGRVHKVSLEQGQVARRLDFGNAQPSEIRGGKWNDANANGVRDLDEGGLAGWTIYIDQNLNGKHDAGEPFAVTGQDGGYAFTELTPGDYVVAEVPRPGWTQTYPMADGDSETHFVSLKQGVTKTGVDFGNWQPAQIQGHKWNDLDADGVWDNGEQGLAGWTVYVDANLNGSLDSGELSTMTDENGHYALVDLPTGTHTIAEVPQQGWKQTWPSGHDGSVTHTIELPQGGLIDGVNFGNWQPAEIRGSKWNDLDGDGHWDRGEPALPGWFVYLDANDNGQHDAGERRAQTDAEGRYAFIDVPAGSHTVAEVLQDGWTQSHPGYDGQLAPHAIELQPGQLLEGVDFGNWQPAQIQGHKWNDLDGDGLWEPGEPGLERWEVYLDENQNGQYDSGERLTLTGSGGEYAFTNLLPGSYTVAEVLLPGWQQTWPADGQQEATYTVALEAGDLLEGFDFGNINLEANYLDFGDAPDELDDPRYPTLAAHDAARHQMVPGFSLGRWIDAEDDGQPSDEADGDDAASIPDDEDGVRFPAGLTAGETDALVEVFVTDLFDLGETSGRYLDAWVDFDGDGWWDNASEKIYSGAVDTGWNAIEFSVPGDAQLGQTYARFRLNSMAAGLLPTGMAANGEVEDHLVNIYGEAPHVDLGDWVLLEDTPGQSVPIHVTGSRQVGALDLYLQVADGGPLAPGGSIAGPIIADVDILTGTVFEADNQGDLGSGQVVPQFWDSGTATGESTVLADGLLATATIDTTGFFADYANNPWDLKLVGTLMGDTTLYMPTPPAEAHFVNGRILLNARPIADLGGPYTVGEGDTIVLDASASYDPDTADGIVRYEWDLDDDGLFESVTVRPTITFSAAGFDGSTSQSVALRVTDNHGFTSESADTRIIQVDNVPPRIDQLEPQSAAILEDQSVTLVGVYSDGGSHDTHELDIDWDGDGTYDETLGVAGGAFEVSHQYLDDMPTGTPSDRVDIGVRLRDDDGGIATADVSATVENVAPSIEALVNEPFAGRMNEPVELLGEFVDPGTLDEHTVTVLWGDGGEDTLTLPVGQRTFALAHAYAANGNYSVSVVLADDDTGSDSQSWIVSVKSAGVVDRHIFYNNSYFDGQDATANTDDFGAIAPHTSLIEGHGPHATGLEEPGKELGKDALLPGQTASFANYTGYSKGINGIMVDIVALADPEGLTPENDFVFRVGNSENSSMWTQLTGDDLPSLAVFEGQGSLDHEGTPSDRVTLIWPDNTIQNQWLQVTVLATERTGLALPDVHYWGNAIGETGEANTESFAFVTVADEWGARQHPHNILDRAVVYDPYDHNKDSLVSAIDTAASRHHRTNFLDALKLFAAPELTPPPEAATAVDPMAVVVPPGGPAGTPVSNTAEVVGLAPEPDTDDMPMAAPLDRTTSASSNSPASEAYFVLSHPGTDRAPDGFRPSLQDAALADLAREEPQTTLEDPLPETGWIQALMKDLATRRLAERPASEQPTMDELLKIWE